MGESVVGEPAVRTVDLPDATATADLARQLAAHLPADTAGWLVLLQGDLGAGKSTLARAMLQALGHRGAVPSPTYTLVEPYDIDGRRVYHVDLYRVAAAEELEFLGWDDLQDGLLLVEWPERVPGLAARADATVQLAYSGAGRRAALAAGSARGAAWLARPAVDTGAGVEG
ncbi:MAG: tRNA (adenosine(37)-N6)-threonylcarbamoyltransferase complex ATPase subunit type 1 TsaE [Woeseiaceae bacterium]|nr:tRNA (adenosine(37)-N6)-threonylcarbamoyltransferase complex ATPase subunit type 1 TsaE [Woeseiaceae bacterium]